MTIPIASLLQSSLIKIRGGSSESSSVDWRFFVAGGICAACSHGITTPIDVVKTKMQTNPEKYSEGVLAAAKDIVKTEGAAFLLSGLGECKNHSATTRGVFSESTGFFSGRF